VVLPSYTYNKKTIRVSIIYSYFSIFLEGKRLMPTVHLSLPDKLYDELKEAAEIYGIQVTDLIKILIKNGVKMAKSGSISSGAAETEKFDELNERLSKIEKAIEDMKKHYERQGRIYASMIKALEERTVNLELSLEELEEKIDREKQVINPQLIDNWSSAKRK